MVAICGESNGNRDRFVKAADGSFTSPPSVYLTLTANPNGTYSLRDKYGLTRQFNSTGLMTAILDRNGNTESLSYDNTGFLTKVQDASGRSLQFTKGANGLLSSVTDPAGRMSMFAYDASGNLTAITDPAGHSASFQYTSTNQMSAVIDPKGTALTKATYDTSGRVVTLVEGERSYTFSYNPAQKKTTKTETTSVPNAVSTFVYNDQGSIVSRTDPLGFVELASYDSNLNLLTTTDKNGNILTFTYDSRGNQTSIKDAAGNTRTITYDSTFNLPLTQTDALGNTTTYSYDSHGNLITLTDPSGAATRMTYDQLGRLIKVLDPNENATTIGHDQYGNVVSTTDPTGAATSATFDIVGRRLTVQDPSGHVTQFSYDTLDHLVGTTDPLGRATTNAYDVAGNLTSRTFPGGAQATFVYDQFNRLIRTVDATNQATVYSFDVRGNLSTKTTPDNRTVQYTYDLNNRLTQKTTSTATTTYQYDRNGNPTRIQNPGAILTFTYNALNKVIAAGTGGTSFQPATTTTFTYDANGNRHTMTDPGGAVTTYSYDVRQLPTTLDNSIGVNVTFTYDNVSRRTQMSRTGGATTSYSYDAASRISALSYASPAGPLNLVYQYDAQGSRIGLTDGAGTHSFFYDAKYQLVGATHPNSATESYAYDQLGNRSSSHLSATYSTNSLNQLTADSVFNYAYSPSGNLITKTKRSTGESTTYIYDAEDQLVQVSFPDNTTASYVYDGLGRRIQKTAAGQITRFVYDSQDIIAEYNSANTLSVRYVYGTRTDEVVAVQRNSAISLVDTDASGSVVRISGGPVTQSTVAYDTFGRTVAQTGTATSRMFQGREFDAETGLYYYRARYYDPQIGRFLTQDPLAYSGGLNLYSFVLNNPLNLTDPSGLEVGFWEGLIPIWGSGKKAYEDFECGRYGWALVNGALAVSDVFLVKAAVTSVVKLGGSLLIKEAEEQAVKEGIYEFTSTSGKTYVGQSGDIDRRLLEHIRSGKVTEEEAAQAVRQEVVGGKTAREIAEQRRIDELGGIRNLENKVNPIGPNRRYLLDQ